jgi:hypothetical protein
MSHPVGPITGNDPTLPLPERIILVLAGFALSFLRKVSHRRLWGSCLRVVALLMLQSDLQYVIRLSGKSDLPDASPPRAQITNTLGPVW